MNLKNKKEFNEFISTLKETNKDWSYFNNYEKIINMFEKFEELLVLIGTVNQEEFNGKLKDAINTNSEFAKSVPLFAAIRQEKVSLIGLEGEIIDLDFNNMDGDSCIKFLDNIGFYRIFQKINKVNIPSYFMGMEVGLDTNGRKNRSGKLMEKVLLEYFENLRDKNNFTKEEFDFIGQIPFSRLSSRFSIDITKDNAKNKRFDFAVKHNNVLYLFETNFFNSGGSKINETLRGYKLLNQEISNYDCSILVKFVYVTDGPGIKSDLQGAQDTFSSIDYMYNISDLEEGLFEN